jgi:ubiquitin-conjugating enzyme E2 T
MKGDGVLLSRSNTCDQESKRPAYAQSDDREQSNELPLSVPVLKTEAVASTELPLFVAALSHQTRALGSAGSQEYINTSNHSKQSPNATESMVVSDSEDSADECEKPPSRSRLSLMRRRLFGKLRN